MPIAVAVFQQSSCQRTFSMEAVGWLSCGWVLKRGKGPASPPSPAAPGALLHAPPGPGFSVTTTERSPLRRDIVSTAPGATGCAAAQACHALPLIVSRPGLNMPQVEHQSEQCMSQMMLLLGDWTQQGRCSPFRQQVVITHVLMSAGATHHSSIRQQLM